MKRPARVLVPALLHLVAVASAACGDGPPARTAGDPSATGGAQHAGASQRGVVPIAFEAKKAGSRAFPFPLVEGKVNGQPTRFILDTGTGSHVIDSALAASAQLGTPAKASSISIDGWGSLPEHAVAVRELPASIRAHGIGGVIAPQLLAESATEAVVIDLVNRRMRARPQSSAWSEMEDLGPLLSQPGPRKFCPVDAGGAPGLVLALDGSVDGEATRFELDTGASRTSLVETSKAVARATTRPVLGRSVVSTAMADTAMPIHGGVPLAFGAWKSTLDVGVSPDAHHGECGFDGRLGIDVLQQCAIAMTTEKMLLACRDPSAMGR